jgi:hypothetical protein
MSTPKDELPKEIRRRDGKLVVIYNRRFPDGTAFRRLKEFDEGAVRSAITYLDRAKAEFDRGNGVGSVAGDTVADWCEYCLTVAMPAQRNQKAAKYSEEALAGFRETVNECVNPHLGSRPLHDLRKQDVKDLMVSLASDEQRARTLYVMTRILELAESKGKRKKGTNPCKGVSLH